jgi:hypothetical protein
VLLSEDSDRLPIYAEKKIVYMCTVYVKTVLIIICTTQLFYSFPLNSTHGQMQGKQTLRAPVRFNKSVKYLRTSTEFSSYAPLLEQTYLFSAPDDKASVYIKYQA